MEAFWAITLSVLAVRSYWKHSKTRTVNERSRNTVKNRWDRKKARREEANRKQEADEIITVIIPTIRDGQ